MTARDEGSKMRTSDDELEFNLLDHAALLVLLEIDLQLFYFPGVETCCFLGSDS